MDKGKRRGVPRDGRLLEAIGLLHAAVGAVYYREDLRAIGRDGILAAVPYRGDKATAFWFLIPSPLVWTAGRLLGSAERSGDVGVQRTTHRVGAASALAAVTLMPVSGFWGWLAISLRGLRRLRGAGA